MNPVTAYRTYRRMMAAQWLDREKLREVQERKLRRLVQRAYENVPYYRTLFDESGVSPDTVAGPEDLERIPITTKSDLQKLPLDSVTDWTMARDRLSLERSSGSAGQPFSVLYDSEFRSVRNSMFLRALRTAGYRLGQKLLLITAPGTRGWSRALLRWCYTSIQDPPARLWEEFMRSGPDWIYGCVTPLRLLAEEVSQTGPSAPKLAGVVTTAEVLDGATRRLLEATFECEVFDFYGLTEMGIVGWECSEHDGYHLADDTVIVEQVALPEDDSRSRLVMTNLDSTAMPFIRFDSGDIGVLDRSGVCKCGRTFSVLRRLEGRLADCVHLADGRRVSPYALTCELEKFQGIGRYQIVQRECGGLTVSVETGGGGVRVAEEAIRRAIRGVLGDGIAIEVEMKRKLAVPPGKKFRVVECMIGDRKSRENPVHEL